MHFVEAAATAAWRSRMCRWWFAARKLLDSLRLNVQQRFVGETVAHSLQYKAFFRCFFLFIEGSMKFVGGMHHHKYNGMIFFFCPKWICHWIFPVHLYLTHDFVNIYFYEIHFRWWLPDYSGKKNYRYHFKFRSIFSFILRIYFFK